jgi:predicted nucleic acid-binding protein
MSKLYIDTNVIIDMIKDRKNEFGENLGNHAMKLFTEAINCKHHLIFSDWLYEELRKHVVPEQINMFFKMAKLKIINLEYDDEDKEKAIDLSSEHVDDALHVVLAEKSNADIIVTSNTTHFNQIRTNIPIKKPKHI